MGSKKKTSVTNTYTTHTNVVKLSYLQTLAINDGLASAQDLQTEAYKSGPITVASNKSKKFDPWRYPVTGLGKKKSSTVKNTVIGGVHVKDTWLQPYYDRVRYAIGIKELNVSRYIFSKTSEFKSVPFKSPKEIVKVSLITDEYIPSQFDSTQTWIKYYVKVEGEEDWVRLQPLNSPTSFNEVGEIIPKIINFNLPKPTTAKLEDKFNYTEAPVKQMRFRAVLSRPDGENLDSITPMLKSYRLMMIPRGE